MATWLTLRHLVVVLSILAAAVNIAGIIPQLIAMLRSRSSKGQSALGWTLAASCSGSLLYVNAVGYHAIVLALGNFLSLSGCVSAALLARHFRTSGAVAAEAVQALQETPEDVVAELPGPDLAALTETVLEEHHRRTGEALPEDTVTDLPTAEFNALAAAVCEEHYRRTGRPELSLGRV